MASKEEAKKLQEIAHLQGTREFARGLRLTKQLLKKSPQCTEALAWESYFTYHKDQAKNKDVAIKMMMDANRLGMKNAKVWRISGLLYKDMTEYTRALQCLRQSFSLDNKNYLVLNDIANLELYERQYNQFLKDTCSIFKNNPTQYTICRYAFALAINGRYELANQFLDTYQKGWRPAQNDDDELLRSEFCLFRAVLMIRSNQYEECIKFLDTNKEIIRDKETMLEDKVNCLNKLGRSQESIPLIHDLIKVYPENGDYFDILEEIIPKDSIIDELLRIKDQYKSHYAHVRVLELIDINDERFKPLLIERVKPLIIKGAPSTYMTISELSKEKLQVALELVRSFEVPLSSVPIVHLFAAHFYGYHGDYESAIRELDEGLQHTPTCIELIAWKARFHCRNGRIHSAIECSAALSEADPADRNTNNLYVKMLLLGGYRRKAEYEASLFAGEESGKQLLYETQFNTYYLKSGLSALRDNDIEFATKMYNGILKHFEDYRKNQYNYLGWAWRRPYALLSMIEEMNVIERNDSLAKAIEMLLSLSIKDKKEKEAKPIAMRSLSCTPQAMAMGCVIFCANKMIVQALKCFCKLSDTPYIYTASPAMEKLMKESNTWHEMVKQVVNEEYKENKKTPQTFDEIYASARGNVFIGQYKEAKVMLLKAIDENEIEFKKALDVYVFATKLCADEDMGNEVAKALKAKYPKYEFDLEKEASNELEVDKKKE
ncbi:TPR Domain containing protein [Histomonas meleagridis]|uniref:TPR Domain containing protein n=1 Tax=Histomonas meleagridis TaxID=135588 RepID=UPI003559F5A7|nr:TPR Domain containing protein [Histomonas meleagridis]KAH0796737.1 TPR Domain containing protein [Histomonas meleagridis]